ncbi:dienelactone hydrolase family protein [Rheinheimera sp.]|uniref:dienelactone hydrolase family protein n=1 Tax=Rheinheimera sp. TaxID=1869214 RepID=UPI00307D026C
MKWLATICSLVTLLLGSNCLAAVTERVVQLPDQLGSAVIYRNNSVKNQGAAVLVIHEWWGFNDYARSRAKMLADLGYTSIAVDMYGTGKVAEHPDNAMAFMEAAMKDPDKVNARFDAAMALLKAESGVNASRIYAMGYCFGGGVVLNQARMGKALAGVASFHGMLTSKRHKADATTLKAKILVAHGGADPFVPAEQATSFVAEMLGAGADLDFRVYPGVKHSFTVPDATEKGKTFNMPFEYNEQADKDSWAALLRMLAS